MNLFVLIDELIAQVRCGAYFAQAAVILALTLYGYLLICAITPSLGFVRKVLLAYPAGLAAFGIVAFLLVVTAIPYTKLTVLIGGILAGILVWAICVKAQKSPLSGIWNVPPKAAAIAGLILLLAILLSCLGFLRVTISNDSVFNYSFYPRLIVHYQGLRPNFNTFLTDVGQGVALINTLPFLFGFEETFGIQHMLNLVFAANFAVALFEAVPAPKKRIRILFACAGTALLLVSMPYLLLAKWVLANDYFAVFMFLAAYLATLGGKGQTEVIRLLYLLIPAISILRIEGGVFVVLLVLCMSILDLKTKDLALGMLLPSILLQALYAARIFLTMSIIAPYRFLTEEKALLMLLLMGFGLVYLLLIKDRFFCRMQKHLGLLIIACLLLINLILCIRDASMYLENLRAFAQNILYSGGWGIFPLSILVIYLLSLNREFRPQFFDLLFLSYLFYVLAVSFMREGGMQKGVGDSGNRVLMQVVPVALFAALLHLAQIFKPKEEETKS